MAECDDAVDVCLVGSCGGLLFPLFGDSEQGGSKEVRALIYLVVLLYVFQGVAVVSDYFMNAVEVITSKKTRVQTAEGRWVTGTQWNGTVANLTLLALGSSAPEILLSCIELMKDEGFSGKLGPSTIVGSAAFNLFVIIGVCIASIPNPADHRAIAGMAVYHVTMIFSLFAYFWLWFIVVVSSEDIVQPWEASVALLMFPVLVFVSWLADKGYMPWFALDPLTAVDDGTKHYLYKHARVRLSQLHRVGTTELELAARKTVKRWKESPAATGEAVDHSRLPYKDTGEGIQDEATGKLISNGYGIITFRSDVEETNAKCCSRHPFSVDVLRRNGTNGTVRCRYRTEGLSAVPAHDFIPKQGMLEFGPGEDTKQITVEILGKRIGEPDDIFQLVLSDVTTEDDEDDEVSDVKAHFNPYDDGGRDKAVCTITIANGNDYNTVSVLERFIDVDNFKVGLEAWSEQIKMASSVEGDADDNDNDDDVDEAKEAQGPSVQDRVMHVVSLPWKMLFALLCPPSNWCGGWLLFGLALLYVAACTAVVIDLASFFGCCADIPQEVTAVTIVALGTSLPDTFASVTSAQEDEHADASIVNVTGSNSVNVFLGIGLPWTIASIFWTTSWGATDEWKRTYPDMVGKHPDGAFVVKAGSLGFTVLVFFFLAAMCIAVLRIRRIRYRGELGGPTVPKYSSAVLLFMLWVTYIACACWKSSAAGQGESGLAVILSVMCVCCCVIAAGAVVEVRSRLGLDAGVGQRESISVRVTPPSEQVALADLEEGNGDDAAALEGGAAAAEEATRLHPGATKPFPAHWGEPPRALTRDYREWPAGFGHGSGIVAKWIEGNLARDGQEGAGAALGRRGSPEIPKLDLRFRDPADGTPEEFYDDEAPAPPDPAASEQPTRQARDSGSASEPRPPAPRDAKQKRKKTPEAEGIDGPAKPRRMKSREAGGPARPEPVRVEEDLQGAAQPLSPEESESTTAAPSLATELAVASPRPVLEVGVASLASSRDAAPKQKKEKKGTRRGESGSPRGARQSHKEARGARLPKK